MRRIARWVVGLFRPLPANGGTNWEEKVDAERRLVVLEYEVKSLQRGRR